MYTYCSLICHGGLIHTEASASLRGKGEGHGARSKGMGREVKREGLEEEEGEETVIWHVK